MKFEIFWIHKYSNDSYSISKDILILIVIQNKGRLSKALLSSQMGTSNFSMIWVCSLKIHWATIILDRLYTDLTSSSWLICMIYCLLRNYYFFFFLSFSFRLWWRSVCDLIKSSFDYLVLFKTHYHRHLRYILAYYFIYIVSYFNKVILWFLAFTKIGLNGDTDRGIKNWVIPVVLFENYGKLHTFVV